MWTITTMILQEVVNHVGHLATIEVAFTSIINDWNSRAAKIVKFPMTNRMAALAATLISTLLAHRKSHENVIRLACLTPVSQIYVNSYTSP